MNTNEKAPDTPNNQDVPQGRSDEPVEITRGDGQPEPPAPSVYTTPPAAGQATGSSSARNVFSGYDDLYLTPTEPLVPTVVPATAAAGRRSLAKPTKMAVAGLTLASFFAGGMMFQSRIDSGGNGGGNYATQQESGERGPGGHRGGLGMRGGDKGDRWFGESQGS